MAFRNLRKTDAVWTHVAAGREERGESVEAVRTVDRVAVELSNLRATAASCLEVFERQRRLRCILGPGTRVTRLREGNRVVTIQRRFVR